MTNGNNFPILWDSRNNHDKRELADLLYSNCILDGRSVSATYKKPFNLLVGGIGSDFWLAIVDYFRTAA